MSYVFSCYAHGHEGGWQAICVDLDIAVDGTSLQEVRASLATSIDLYLEDGCRVAGRRAATVARASLSMACARQDGGTCVAASRSTQQHLVSF